MKTYMDVILPSLYGIPTSMLFINMLSKNVAINTLTLGVYIANILVIYILHKLGGYIDKWVKHY